jgi:hypothetical protein
MSCAVKTFTSATVPAGVDAGKALGVWELAGAWVGAVSADGSGVTALATGVTVVGVAAGRSVGVASRAATATGAVAAGVIAV